MSDILNTRRKTIATLPPMRKTQCKRCPFGKDLNFFETLQVEVLKDRLRDDPSTMWACHETAGVTDGISNKALLCPGFIDWRESEMRRSGAL